MNIKHIIIAILTASTAAMGQGCKCQEKTPGKVVETVIIDASGMHAASIVIDRGQLIEDASNKVWFTGLTVTNWTTQLDPDAQIDKIQFGEVVEIKQASFVVDGDIHTVNVSTNKVKEICRSYRPKPKVVEYDFWGEREPTSYEKSHYYFGRGLSWYSVLPSK